MHLIDFLIKEDILEYYIENCITAVFKKPDWFNQTQNTGRRNFNEIENAFLWLDGINPKEYLHTADYWQKIYFKFKQYEKHTDNINITYK